MNDTRNKQRDYDKEPIVIKNYAVYFQGALLYMLALVLIYLWIGDLQNGRFEKMDYYSFEFFRIVISILFILWLIKDLLMLPKRFEKFPSIFTFKNNGLSHIRYLYDKDEDTQKNYLEVDIKEVANVSYCVMTEFPYQYGRWNIDSTWKKKRKFAIDIDFGELVLLVRYAITYLFFVLPYKLWRLYKAKEPLKLLRKNLFIQFTNRNYFLVNIYSQIDLDELLEYFKMHNIPVNQKTYFIPHLQNDGWFVDKEEKWTDEFKNQRGEK